MDQLFVPFGKSIFFQLFAYKLQIYNLQANESNKVEKQTNFSSPDKCLDFFGLEKNSEPKAEKIEQLLEKNLLKEKSENLTKDDNVKKDEKSDKKEMPSKKNKDLNKIAIKIENENFNNEKISLNSLNECSPIINRKKRKLIMDGEENEEDNFKKIKKDSNEMDEKEQRFKRLFKMRNLEKNVCPICLSKKKNLNTL